MATKQISWFRWFPVSAILCVVCVLAAETQEALVTFHAADAPSLSSMPFFSISSTEGIVLEPGICSEFIIDEDGSVVLFAGDVFRWRSGKWSKDDRIPRVGWVQDAVRSPDGKWFVLTTQGDKQCIVYQYDGATLLQVGIVSGRFMFSGNTLHPAPDGTLWIATKGPTLYGIKDGKTILHELFPKVSSQTYYDTFSTPLSLAAPGQGLWFWSPADYRSNSAADVTVVNEFPIYRDGKWRAAPHSSGLFGGATPIDSNTILSASRDKGLFTISLSDGSMKELNWALPEKESCIFLHHTPSHHVLAITAEPVESSQLARTGEGAFGKLVLFENGRARVLLDGIDWGEGRFDKGRPVVDTPEGTFIATVRRGLVFVPSDASEARRIDWRDNIPIMNADRMRVRDNLLYLLDKNRGMAVVDWTQLLKATESSQADIRWKVYPASATAAAGPDGSIWWFDANQASGQLFGWRDGKMTSASLAGARFSGTNIRNVAVDRKGGVWLIPATATRPIAYYASGKWRIFNQSDAAWSTIALEEKDNPSFGLVGSCYVCPVFGGNGQVVHRDSESGFLHYFNGATWQIIDSLPPKENYWSEDPLSFENGALTLRTSSEYYKYIGNKWLPQSGQIESGPVRRQPIPGKKFVPPYSFPGDKDRCTISFNDMANTSWMGNLEELYRGMKDKWVRFPTRGTPLFTATHLSNVLIDGSGDMWFVLHNGMSTQIAHSLNSGNALTLEWKTSPAVIVKAARTEFSCRVSQKINGRVELLYRIDEGAWKQFGLIDSQQPLVVENLPNGMHKIEVRAYDEIFRASQPLTAAFEVKRDYNEEIQDLISQLRDIERREAAARTLIAIGKQAVPVLKDQLEKADSSSQWWIRAILDEIGRTDK